MLNIGVKKYFLLLSLTIIVLAGLIRFAKPVGSQSDPGEEFRNSLAEYQRVFAEYVSAREDYVLKRSQYLSYKTLKSQTDAYEATLVMLRTRDNVYLEYIETLSVKLRNVPGLTQEKREALQLRLDAETLWYANHRDSLPSAGTLDDLVEDNLNAEKHREISEGLFYEVLVYLADGQVNDYMERTTELMDDIKDKVELIKNDQSEDAFGNEKLSLIDRWIFEAESRIVRAQEKKLEGLEEIQELSKGRIQQYPTIYGRIIDTYNLANLHLKEANAFAGEVISEIKRAD